MALEQVDGYFIKCEYPFRQNDCYLSDHWRGPYSSKEAVDKKVEKFRNERKREISKKSKILGPIFGSTQDYIKRGYFKIIKSKGEKLPDGRLIFGERVFSSFGDLEKTCDEFNEFFDLGEIK